MHMYKRGTRKSVEGRKIITVHREEAVLAMGDLEVRGNYTTS